jgi:hypothetical protein
VLKTDSALIAVQAKNQRADSYSSVNSSVTGNKKFTTGAA